jgi:hypothetical protein
MPNLHEHRCCSFCACVDTTIKYKQITCANMLQFLRSNIIPTPYLFTFLVDRCKVLTNKLEDDGAEDPLVELLTLCVNCDSWIRRQVSKPKAYLHADAVFLNILFPGSYELPEERSCLRVVYNVCCCNDGQNFLQSVAPGPAKEFFAVFTEKYLSREASQRGDALVPASSEHWHILSKAINGESLKHRRQEQRSHIRNKIVYIWWQRNRRCEFLSNKYTAKLLRHIIHGMP